MSNLASNLLAFETHLDELLAIVNNNESTNRLRQFLNSALNWDALRDDQRDVVRNFFKSKVPSNSTVNNSLYLSAVASFESFLVNNIVAVIYSINISGKKFETLNPALIKNHIDLTGRILSTINSPPDHINVDFDKLCRQIATCYAGTANYTFNTEIAGFVSKILPMDGFFQFLKNCEIQIDFDAISQSQEVKSEFGTTSVRETSSEIIIFLGEIKRMRNRIAHTGQSVSDVSNERFFTLVGRLRAISKSISHIIDQQLRTKYPVSKSR